MPLRRQTAWMHDELDLSALDGDHWWVCEEPERPFHPRLSHMDHRCQACRIYLDALARQTPDLVLSQHGGPDDRNVRNFTAREAAALYPIGDLRTGVYDDPDWWSFHDGERTPA